MLKEEIIKEKIGKIKILTKNILKITYPFCGEETSEVSDLSEIVNQETYQIKCLLEEIEGLLNSKGFD